MNKKFLNKLLMLLFIPSIFMNSIAPIIHVNAEENYQEGLLTLKSINQENETVLTNTPVIRKDGMDYISIKDIAQLTRSTYEYSDNQYTITHGGGLRTLKIDLVSKSMTDSAIPNVEYDISIIPYKDDYVFPAEPLLIYLGASTHSIEKENTLVVSMPRKTYWEAISEVPYDLLYVHKEKNIALRSISNHIINIVSTFKVHGSEEMLPQTTVFDMMKENPSDYESVQEEIESIVEFTEGSLEIVSELFETSTDLFKIIKEGKEADQKFIKQFFGNVKKLPFADILGEKSIKDTNWTSGLETAGKTISIVSTFISAVNNLYDRSMIYEEAIDVFQTVSDAKTFSMANYHIPTSTLEQIEIAIQAAEKMSISIGYEVYNGATDLVQEAIFNGLTTGLTSAAVALQAGRLIINLVNDSSIGKYTPFGEIKKAKADMQAIYAYLFFEEFENLRNGLLPNLDEKGINRKEDFELDVRVTNALLRSAIVYRKRKIDYIKAEMVDESNKIEIIENQIENLAKSLYQIENLYLDDLDFYYETDFINIPNNPTQAYSTERVSGIIRDGKVYQIGSFYDTNSDEKKYLTEFQPHYVMDNIESVKVGATGNDSYAESFFAKSLNDELYGWGSMRAYSDIVYTKPTIIDQGIEKLSLFSGLGVIIYNKNGTLYLYDNRGGLPGYELGVPLSMHNLNNVLVSNSTYGMLGDDGRFYSGLDNQGRPVVTTREERLENPSDALQTFFVNEKVDDYSSIYRRIILKNDNSLYYVGRVDRDSEDYSEETLLATNVKKVENIEDDGIAFITNTDDLYVLGRNSYGVLGVGHYDRVFEPTLIMNDVKDIRFSKDKSGYTESGMSILTNSGDVYVTGVYEVPWQWYLDKNQWGEYRKPLYTAAYGVSIPQLMISGVREFASGNGNVVVKEDNSVWSWGYNNYGELGGINYLQDNSITYEDEDSKFVFPIELFTSIQ